MVLRKFYYPFPINQISSSTLVIHAGCLFVTEHSVICTLFKYLWFSFIIFWKWNPIRAESLLRLHATPRIRGWCSLLDCKSVSVRTKTWNSKPAQHGTRQWQKENSTCCSGIWHVEGLELPRGVVSVMFSSFVISYAYKALCSSLMNGKMAYMQTLFCFQNLCLVIIKMWCDEHKFCRICAVYVLFCHLKGSPTMGNVREHIKFLGNGKHSFLDLTLCPLTSSFEWSNVLAYLALLW